MEAALETVPFMAPIPHHVQHGSRAYWTPQVVWNTCDVDRRRIVTSSFPELSSSLWRTGSGPKAENNGQNTLRCFSVPHTTV